MVDVHRGPENPLFAPSRVEVAAAEDSGLDHLLGGEARPEDGTVWEDEPAGAVSLGRLGLVLFGFLSAVLFANCSGSSLALLRSGCSACFGLCRLGSRGGSSSSSGGALLAGQLPQRADCWRHDARRRHCWFESSRFATERALWFRFAFFFDLGSVSFFSLCLSLAILRYNAETSISFEQKKNIFHLIREGKQKRQEKLGHLSCFISSLFFSCFYSIIFIF